MRFTRVYGCVGVGHPSSSTVMGIKEDRVDDSSFRDQILGPLRGWRSAVKRVATFRAIAEGQSDLPPHWDWKASFKGHCWNLVAACVSETRAVAPRDPWSFRMLVHELVVAEQ